MTEVQSVLGPIEADELGWVLMHEHFFVYFTGYEIDGRNPDRNENDFRCAVEQTNGLLQYGVRTVVDPTPSEFRRVDVVADIARASGMNIVVCTGLYTEDNDGFPAYFRHRSVDEIADWMVAELTEGIGRTDVRAGAIKVATGVGRITANEEKALRAAARAQREAPVPIITHTSAGTMGREQVEILADEGADLSRVVIGHCDANGDLNYHFDILRTGASIGVDQVGFEGHGSDEIRLGLVLAAYSAGYAAQIMLSGDHIHCIYGRHTKPRPHGKSHLLTTFLPALRARGASDRDIETSMRELPRRLLAGQPSAASDIGAKLDAS